MDVDVFILGVSYGYLRYFLILLFSQNFHREYRMSILQTDDTSIWIKMEEREKERKHNARIIR